MSGMALISFHLFMNNAYTSFMKVLVTWYFHNKCNIDSVLRLQKVHSDKIPGINLDIILFVLKCHGLLDNETISVYCYRIWFLGASRFFMLC